MNEQTTTEPMRVSCPTIYPRRERWMSGMDYDKPGIVTTDVPCDGQLVVCDICGQRRRCTYEARCLDSERADHVVKRLFSIDGGPVVEGWTRGETWNGWACPRFEIAAALAIVDWQNGNDPGSMLADDNDQTIRHMPTDDPDAGETWRGETLATPEGQKFVFAIGAWAWIWDDVTDDIQPEPVKDMDGTYYHARPDFDTRDREGR